MNKPRGRRPGNPDTRARILDAAHARLLTHGYVGTTLRAVAADAGVNVALISYYFGSKQGLFSAVMALAVSPPTVLAAALQGDPAQLPERLLAAVLAVWDEPSTGAPLRSLVSLAMAEPSSLQAVVEFLEREVIVRLAEWLGGPQATARAAAAVTTIAGVVFTRYVLGLQPVAGMPRCQLVHHLSPALRASLATTRHRQPAAPADVGCGRHGSTTGARSTQ